MPKYAIVFISLVVAIIVGLGIWWLVAAQPAAAPTPANETDTTELRDSTGPTTETTDMVIVFTDSGFERQTYNVNAGDTVSVRNDSSMSVEFSSDEHPTHTDNPELNLRSLEPGGETSFNPENAGTWGIHDHEHPEFTTTLVIRE